MIRAFLLGMRGGGGEEVFVRGLAESPPPGVRYSMALDAHESVDGARALHVREILFNRLVHPFLWPLPGLRAYRVSPGIDLVHVHNMATWLRLPEGCPVVYSVGGGSYIHYLEAYLGWTRERVRARYARARAIYSRLGIRSEVATHERVDAVFVRSPIAAEQLRALSVPDAKISVIPPGFRIPEPAAPPRDTRPYTFLLVGRDPHRKGADVAVEAVRSLAATREVRLHLVGDAAYPEMADGTTVFGWGPVPRKRLYEEFFGAADAVLVPSRAEGFGFAAVEALGHGLPAVVSDRDALPWIVQDCGIRVAPGDAAALRRAMEALADDPPAGRAMGAAGRERFLAEFTVERFHERLAALYHAVLERARR